MKYINEYCVCTQDPKFEDKTETIKIFYNANGGITLMTGEDIEDPYNSNLIVLAPDMINDVIEILTTLKKDCYETK